MREVFKAEEGEVYDIELEADVLKANEKLAEENKELLRKHRVVAIDVMGAIGSGKTSLIEKMVQALMYEVLTKDTIMEGSKLRIEERNGLVRCSGCSYEGGFKYQDDPVYHVPTPTLRCPECGGTVEIVGGRGCLIKSVKLVV